MNALFLSRVTSIFNKHYQYYQSIGVETIKQQAGQVEQVSADYQGRIIFELLQNAFDKAERSIKVIIRDNCLYIANDGTTSRLFPLNRHSFFGYSSLVTIGHRQCIADCLRTFQ